MVPSAAAALLVVGVRRGTEPAAQFMSETVVDVALAVSVTNPVALERPAASCCTERMTRFGSFSVNAGT